MFQKMPSRQSLTFQKLICTVKIKTNFNDKAFNHFFFQKSTNIFLHLKSFTLSSSRNQILQIRTITSFLFPTVLQQFIIIISKMLSFNEYSPRVPLHLKELKYDIDHKISRISWMISQREKRQKQKNYSQKVIENIGTQTIEQYHLSSQKDFPLMVEKFMDSSIHTKAYSSVGISTNDFKSLNKINFLTQTQNSSDISFENTISVKTSGIRSENQYTYRVSQQDSQKNKENKERQINIQFITDKEIKSPIKQQPQDQVQDSLDMSIERKRRLQQKRDEKFFTQQNLKQSLIVSISSAVQEKKKKEQFNPIQNKMDKQQKFKEIKNKTPIKIQNKLTTVNKINKKQMPKKQLASKLSGRKKSLKKQTQTREELSKKKQNIKQKIVSKNKSASKHIQTVKSQGNIPNHETFLQVENSMNTEFNDNILQDLNIRQNKSVNFQQNIVAPFKSKQVARKNIKTQKSSGKIPSQQIIISPQVKEKMKSLVSQISPRDRKEDNESAVRSNLLKRIEDRYKPMKN